MNVSPLLPHGFYHGDVRAWFATNYDKMSIIPVRRRTQTSTTSSAASNACTRRNPTTRTMQLMHTGIRSLKNFPDDDRFASQQEMALYTHDATHKHSRYTARQKHANANAYERMVAYLRILCATSDVHMHILHINVQRCFLSFERSLRWPHLLHIELHGTYHISDLIVSGTVGYESMLHAIYLGYHSLHSLILSTGKPIKFCLPERW